MCLWVQVRLLRVKVEQLAKTLSSKQPALFHNKVKKQEPFLVSCHTRMEAVQSAFDAGREAAPVPTSSHSPSAAAAAPNVEHAGAMRFWANSFNDSTRVEWHHFVSAYSQAYRDAADVGKLQRKFEVPNRLTWYTREQLNHNIRQMDGTFPFQFDENKVDSESRPDSLHIQHTHEHATGPRTHVADGHAPSLFRSAVV